MTSTEFSESLEQPQPPENVSVYLKALWYDAKDEWHTAHNLIDNMEDKTACWVHAYLHRKEGDNWNANYWYNKAGRKMPLISLEDEWQYIVSYLLNEAATA